MKQKDSVFCAVTADMKVAEMVRQMSVLRRMEHHERIQGRSPVSAARGTNTFHARRHRGRLCSSDIDTGDESAVPCLESVNSTAFSAAALCMARLCWSAVSRASANQRCCCKCVRKCAKMPACSMFRARNRSSRSKFVRHACTFLHPSCTSSAETDMEQIINETELHRSRIF